MKKQLKNIIYSLIPSLILGFGAYYLISLLSGMEGIVHTSIIWLFIATILFIFHFAKINSRRYRLSIFLKYAAYECWLSPFCIVAFVIRSIFQATNNLGSAGALGVGIAGGLLIFIFTIVGGLLGIILYLAGKLIINKASKETEEPDLHLIANEINSCPESKFSSDKDDKILQILQWALPTLVVLVIIYSFTNNQSENKETITYVSSIRGYVLNQKESRLLNIILTDDSSNFVSGKPSALNDIAKLPVLSVTTIVRAYNENQVAADQQYFKKKLHISGVISGINSGILNKPYLT